MPGSDGNAAAAAATLDSDFQRKIPREKFRAKINTPRARKNVRRLGVVTLVQHTAGGKTYLLPHGADLSKFMIIRD
jgi:hypothetical protein